MTLDPERLEKFKSRIATLTDEAIRLKLASGFFGEGWKHEAAQMVLELRSTRQEQEREVAQLRGRVAQLEQQLRNSRLQTAAAVVMAAAAFLTLLWTVFGSDG